MSIHAGFFKRLFSFIVDLTLVIVVTWLLYLFPFNMIISRGIDKDYKNNIKKPYEAISEEYSGKVSYFGTSSKGKFAVLGDLYNNKTMSKNELDSYNDILFTNYTIVSGDLSNLLTKMNEEYSADTAMENQFYSIVYRDYNYIQSANAILDKTPMDDIFSDDYAEEHGKYVSYSKLVGLATINEDKKVELEKQYKSKLTDTYKDVLASLIKSLNAYNEKYSNSKTTGTLAYTTISSAYSQLKGKVSEVGKEFTQEDLDKIINFVNTYRQYQTFRTNLTAEADGNVKFDEEIYNIFYYGLNFEQFNLQLPYYAQVYNHTTWAIIYSLAMFTLVFSIYTAAMRGYTLGRRCVKIKLTDGHEKEKLNPVLALLHDVPFKFLYIILFGLFSLLAAGIAMIVFTVADIIMISFTRNHKALRDYMSGTRVIEARSY